MTRDVPVQVAAAQVGASRVTNAQILDLSCRTTYDFCFMELLTTVDSPRVVFHIIMDAFQPFFGQYYQVRLLSLYLRAWSQISCPALRSIQYTACCQYQYPNCCTLEQIYHFVTWRFECSTILHLEVYACLSGSVLNANGVNPRKRSPRCRDAHPAHHSRVSVYRSTTCTTDCTKR